jgi:hypothetical protein
MNITSIWQNNKQYIILGTTGVALIIASFLLDFVKIGMLIVGVGIIIYIVVSIAQNVRSKKNNKQFI